MLFSFVIPYYNRQDTIERALDSIYSQGLPLEDFEIIVVDDCSPNPLAVEKVKSYMAERHTSNLRLVLNCKNLRMGGARNRGVSEAVGDWIVYLDSDDYFLPNSFGDIKMACVQHPELDIIAGDSDLYRDGQLVDEGHYSKVNKPGICTGKEYMTTQEVSWSVWHFIFKRELLQREGIRFVEKANFEDADYSIKAIVSAKKVMFIPNRFYAYLVTSQSTSSIGNDSVRISEFLGMSTRVKAIGETLLRQGDEKTARSVLWHHHFIYKSVLMHYLWRISPSKIYSILKRNKPLIPSPFFIVNFSARCPFLLAGCMGIARPFLLLLQILIRKFR